MTIHLRSAAFVALSLATCAWIGAFAQSANTSSPSDVSDASATVPTVTYRSAWTSISLSVEQTPTDWRQANAHVGRFTRGHVDILKSETLENDQTPSTTPTNPHKH